MDQAAGSSGTRADQLIGLPLSLHPVALSGLPWPDPAEGRQVLGPRVPPDALTRWQARRDPNCRR